MVSFVDMFRLDELFYLYVVTNLVLYLYVVINLVVMLYLTYGGFRWPLPSDTATNR